jgi:hypothetical protein
MTVDNRWNHPASAVWVADPSVSCFTSGSFIMSSLSRLLWLLMIGVSSGPVWAGTVGPFDDGQLFIPSGSPGKWVYNTSWSGHTGNGHSVGGSDLLFVNWDGSIDIWLFGRVFVQPGGGVAGRAQTVNLI